MAIITEFEQTSFLTQNLDQSEPNQSVVKMVNELLSRAKRHRMNFDKDWHFNYEFVIAGRQWPIERPRWRFNESINTIWADIMTEIAIQTDAKPKFEFASEEFGDEPFIDVLKQINDRNWEKMKWNGIVQDALFDAKIYHVGHALVDWDAKAASGLGEVDIEILDPFFCFWDPQAYDINNGRRKARYFIYAEPRPTSELKLNYPDDAEKIKPDVNLFEVRSNQATVQLSRIATNFDPFIVTRLPSDAMRLFDNQSGEQLTTLLRVWLRDDTLEQIAKELNEVDPLTNKPKKQFILKKKFPKGRYLEIANNLLLRDAEPGTLIRGKWVPYETDNFPLAKLVNYSYPREYAGENEVTHSRGPQKIINYIWSYILDMFRMQANPKTIISTASGIDPESLTNDPALIIETNEMSGYRQEPGQAIAPGSFNLLDTAIELKNKVQGLQDISRGASDTAVKSGILFEGIAEAAQTRPRLKNRNLELFLQDVGVLVLERYLQFYTQPRVFRITNKEGFPEVIEFMIPEIRKDGSRVVKIKRRKTVDGQLVSEMTKTFEVKGMPDVRVKTGSALPFARAVKNQQALTFFNAQAIDREELLKATDWPNHEEVIKRIEEKEKAAAQAQGG